MGLPATPDAAINKADSVVRQFMSDLVTHTKYASYLPDEKRRQNWFECVTTLMDMHIRKYPAFESEIREAFSFVFAKKVLPSMRSMQFGGLPIEVAPNRIFNCTYAPMNHRRVFDELMFLLLGGSGTGYSVRGHHVAQLDYVKKPGKMRRYYVNDSIEGWCDATRQLISAYLLGKPEPRFDYRDIRPAGSLIRKTGGRAPGPDRLRECHDNIRMVLRGAVGRSLTTLEVHDINCFAAGCVQAGGVREAAMIALFSPDDQLMLTCKGMYRCADQQLEETTEKHFVVSFLLPEDQPMDTTVYGYQKGDRITVKIDNNQYGGYDLEKFLKEGLLAWYYVHPQRGRANNSVALRRDQTTRQQFDWIWDTARASMSGEPGIFWCNNDEDGTNPCVETNLKPFQFCNLTTTVVYDVTSQSELNRRVRAAAFIGTLQASYTDFHYLRPIWKQQTELDALLGVSMTGIASGSVLKLDLAEAAREVVKENERVAAIIGINPAQRTTCLKPEGSGTLAAGVDGHGIHALHGDTGYNIRNNRIKKSDPVYQFLIEKGYPFIEDEPQNPERAVVSMPMRPPEGAINGKESALDMLERIKKFSLEWIVPGHKSGSSTHNVSATVTVRENEWDVVKSWMWENRETYNGLSVFPYFGSSFHQAPFVTIPKEQYEEMVLRIPHDINFQECFEEQDFTSLMGELACSGGACLI